MRSCLLLLCWTIIACSTDRAATPQPTAPSTTTATRPTAPPETADQALAREQDEYVADVAAFTKTTKDAVRARMKMGSVPLKNEWETWERAAPMVGDRIAAFYKQTTNYIYELGEWHLFVPGKRESDVALVEDLKSKAPKNVLDFGGGVGMTAIPLARAGLDVTLADLDSTSLTFAAYRAEKHGVRLKLWKSDVDPMPPDAKYDVILALDVLEHLPKDVLHDVVNKLIKLKHARTEIIMNAPFGKTSVHPMHMDADDDTRHQVERLKTELPPE